MKITKLFTISFLVFMLSLSFAFANPSDLILEARNGADVWKTGESYTTGQIVSYDGDIYEVVQSHTSQTNWKPNEVPALFTQYSFQDLGEVPTFKQPTGSQDAYQTGDKVRFNGYIFESTINANVWTPVTYPAGWTKVSIDTGVKLPNSDSVVFKDKTFYTGDVAVKGKNLTGSEIFVSDRQLVGLADYQKEEFEVSMYTGNDGVKYSIYSYTDPQSNLTLTDNRTLVRQEGIHLFDVYSKDGFLNK